MNDYIVIETITSQNLPLSLCLLSSTLCRPVISPRSWFNIKMSSNQYRISHCGDRWSHDPLISTLGFPILRRRHLYMRFGALPVISTLLTSRFLSACGTVIGTVITVRKWCCNTQLSITLKANTFFSPKGRFNHHSISGKSLDMMDTYLGIASRPSRKQLYSARQSSILQTACRFCH